MVNRRLAVWLRPAFALIGVLGLATLAGCGGGSGAPNNPYVPPPPAIPPLTILPGAISVYSGTPSTLTISGGVAPYRAFTSDASVLPLPTNVSGDTIVLSPNNVTAQTGVSVTVQDSVGTVSTGVTVTVNPAPLLPSLITVIANPNPACDGTVGNLCSGGTGTASVKVTGAGGVGLPGRQVKFDVVQGAFSIVSTNPAQPQVSTLTVATDVNGTAVVVLSVPPDTPTQTGIIRATDVTTGNQVTGDFKILQVTTGGAVLSVLPLGNTTITGPDNLRCSSGVTVTNYIFGGTPPYQVAVNFPQAVTLSGVPVLTNGGAFNTTTNGACFINLTYVITDATGRTIPGGSYPTVTNQLGTSAPPAPPPTTLVATPGAISKVNCVPANTFQFVLTGGTPPFSVVTASTTSSTSVVLSPQTGITTGQAVTVSGITSPAATSITAFDSGTPRQSASVSIDCTGAPPPPTPPSLVIAPGNFDYSATIVREPDLELRGHGRHGAVHGVLRLAASGRLHLADDARGLRPGLLGRRTHERRADDEHHGGGLEHAATAGDCDGHVPDHQSADRSADRDARAVQLLDDDVRGPDVELRDHRWNTAVLHRVPDAAECRGDDQSDDRDGDAGGGFQVTGLLNTPAGQSGDQRHDHRFGDGALRRDPDDHLPLTGRAARHPARRPMGQARTPAAEAERRPRRAAVSSGTSESGAASGEDGAQHRIGDVGPDHRATERLEQHEADRARHHLLVAPHQRHPAIEPQRRRVGRQSRASHERAQARDIVLGQRAQAPRHLGREHHAGPHRFAVQPDAIPQRVLDRVAERMAQVQERALAMFTFVRADDLRLDPAALEDRMRGGLPHRPRPAPPCALRATRRTTGRGSPRT